MSPNTWSVLNESHAALRAVLAGLRPAHLLLPTPCERWNVTQVLQHAAGDQLGYAAAITGEGGPAKRKRALTIDMIDKISRAWHIPVAALANPYSLAPGSRWRSQGARPALPSERPERARVRAGKQARS